MCGVARALIVLSTSSRTRTDAFTPHVAITATVIHLTVYTNTWRDVNRVEIGLFVVVVVNVCITGMRTVWGLSLSLPGTFILKGPNLVRLQKMSQQTRKEIKCEGKLKLWWFGLIWHTLSCHLECGADKRNSQYTANNTQWACEGLWPLSFNTI